MTKKLFSIFAVLCFATSAISGSADLILSQADSRYAVARSAGSNATKKSEYLKAAADYRKFVDEYPSHEKNGEALFRLGSIYEELSRLDQDRDAATRSLHYFRTAAEKSKGGSLAVDAHRREAAICQDIFKDQHCHDEALKGLGLTSVSKTASLSQVAVVDEAGGQLVTLVLSASRSFSTRFIPSDAGKKESPRFVMDLSETTLSAGLPKTKEVSGSCVVRIRFGQSTPTDARAVLDLAADVKEEQVEVKSVGDRLEVRIRSLNAPSTPAPVAETKSTLKPKTDRRHRIIVDAGHGGDDTGAIGKRGTEEKDICLTIAKKLVALLKADPDFEVFMTRSDDRFIPLPDRTRLANEWNGDLFVSIHANASPRRTARGVSTYFLDNADDEESLRVAMRENGNLGPESPVKSASPDEYYLEVMKASMEKNFHTVQSTDLARQVQSSLIKELNGYSGVDDLGVRSARFYVLTGAKMPSVLVETSFISNPDEEKRLKDSKYQDRITRAVHRGIDRFIKSQSGKGDHAALYSPEDVRVR